MLHVGFYLCDQMLATSLTLPIEQLKTAEVHEQARFSRRPKTPRSTLKIYLISKHRQSIQSHSGIPFRADHTIDEFSTPLDILYLPALWRNPRKTLRENRELIGWLRTLNTQGTRIVGVGTGCSFLAEAGLLDGKPATTHWHYFDTFAKLYPKVLLQRQYFITQSNNLFCAGGINALADLTVHFIQQYFQKTTAQHVEKHFFHELRHADETTKAIQENQVAHCDEDIIQIQTWIKNNFSENIDIKTLSDKFTINIRTLNRRFKKATNTTPTNYLQKIRINHACDLLKTTNLTINEVMYKVGYQDSTHFSSLFKKYHEVTPGQYRSMVRSKLFSV